MITPATINRLAYGSYVIREESPFRNWEIKIPAPRITLHDGHSLSIQSGAHTYCSPRCNGQANYSSFEIGFPTYTPRFLRYAEDPETPTDTVYGYVPIEEIIDDINSHGGLSFSSRVAAFCAVYTNEYFDGECF